MNDMTQQPTDRDAAREALATAASTTLDNSHDRSIHGWATVGFGALVAVFTGLSRGLGGETFMEDLPVTAIYVLCLFAVAAWQSRSTKTWPAGTKRLSSIGVGLSVILSLVGNMVLNWKGQAGSAPVGWIVAVALLALLPSLVAGLLIRRGRR